MKSIRPPKQLPPPIARSLPAFTGLHPGAALVTGDGKRTGGVACLLGDAGPTHLLTAGHLFPAGAVGMGILTVRTAVTRVVSSRMLRAARA